MFYIIIHSWWVCCWFNLRNISVSKRFDGIFHHKSHLSNPADWILDSDTKYQNQTKNIVSMNILHKCIMYIVTKTYICVHCIWNVNYNNNEMLGACFTIEQETCDIWYEVVVCLFVYCACISFRIYRLLNYSFIIKINYRSLN